MSTTTDPSAQTQDPEAAQLASGSAQSADAGSSSAAAAPLRSPQAVRDRVQQLIGVRRTIERRRKQEQAHLDGVLDKLELASQTTDTLEHLGDQLFGHTIKLLEEKLTIALQEVLEQPLLLKAECRYLRGAAAIEFHIERDGNVEDILKGQGGSVANILSVGLRMFALTTLDPAKHRRFLVLDEQDCWLRPDLVPRLARIISQAGRELDFQVILISHHNTHTFHEHADRIYRFEPSDDGVKVHLWRPDDA